MLKIAMKSDGPRVRSSVCRPQLSSASPQYSTGEVLENSSLQGSNRIFGFLPFRTLEVPWRRSLKGGDVGGGRGGGGGGGTSTTVTIIVVVSTVTFVLLLTALAYWCSRKKRKNPNWRRIDCLKRNKLPREKMFTSVKSDVHPDADAEHKVAIDVRRLDQTSKSRKQVSLCRIDALLSFQGEWETRSLAAPHNCQVSLQLLKLLEFSSFLARIGSGDVYVKTAMGCLQHDLKQKHVP